MSVDMAKVEAAAKDPAVDPAAMLASLTVPGAPQPPKPPTVFAGKYHGEEAFQKGIDEISNKLGLVPIKFDPANPDASVKHYQSLQSMLGRIGANKPESEPKTGNDAQASQKKEEPHDPAGRTPDIKDPVAFARQTLEKAGLKEDEVVEAAASGTLTTEQISKLAKAAGLPESAVPLLAKGIAADAIEARRARDAVLKDIHGIFGGEENWKDTVDRLKDIVPDEDERNDIAARINNQATYKKAAKELASKRSQYIGAYVGADRIASGGTRPTTLDEMRQWGAAAIAGDGVSRNVLLGMSDAEFQKMLNDAPTRKNT